MVKIIYLTRFISFSRYRNQGEKTVKDALPTEHEIDQSSVDKETAASPFILEGEGWERIDWPAL